MKSSLRLAAAVSLFTLSQAAFAASVEGPYVTLGGGVNGLQDFKALGAGPGANTTFDVGGAGFLSAGYGLSNGLRFELEVNFRENELDKVQGIPANGRARQIGVLGNAIYEFEAPGLPFIPHVGVGLGMASTRLSGADIVPGANKVNGTDNPFAYQFIAGAEYPVMPHLKLGLEFRHFATSNVTIGAPRTSGGPAPRATTYDLSNNGGFLTLRYEFGSEAPAPKAAEPPPPPPAPVQPPAKVEAPKPAVKPEVQRAFQVFFDFNKSDITAAAAKVIQAAADNVKAGNVTRIIVTGHTDTVGSAKYNQALSERRADAVKGQLAADGVKAEDIATSGVGKTGLLVPTADGIREPQNRRAEIVLQ